MGASERIADIERKTNETDIRIKLNLDGKGTFQGTVGIGFVDHMLELFARHGRLDLEVAGKGDLHIDQHHLVEDLGITLGQALARAAGDKRGIARFGQAAVPMEETLVDCVLDFCGRPFLAFNVEIGPAKVGDFDTELTEDFFRALAMHAGLTLHLNLKYGRNAHHVIEALFKATARALALAVRIDPGVDGVLSTKGKL
ncbi:MAG TPA: imidazoleglycerol-phosphate dehydratase HisB [Candidatus Sumerlaeota bacterium]|nr:imidazoleglycerol-phosphate dehydratase HisB [Candidatus Sumerlaeota bacterium]HOR28882.1 imidazoleglycerol-phosphate dehydratase HisB [Candidatus Sumerlaeota bacterium]HPK04086.1 imidazoleglycerol-phosphate dehydratase HisB [Candidatus Sumerlaeota bacterium]